MNLVIHISAFISTALAIYCSFPYIFSILKGKTKPHQLSWLVFSIMNGIILFSQLFLGAHETVLIYIIFFMASLVIFLLSLKYGIRESSRWDKALFIFALFTIVIWYLTKSNELAIWLTVVIDVAAMTMTILKIKAQPYSEDPLAWILASIAYVFTIITLVKVPFGILYVRPLYGLGGDLVLIFFIYFWRKKKKQKIETSPVEG